MATNINKLLDKKGWTGKEVGQALMSSLLYDIAKPTRGLQGKNDALFTQADLERMEKSLEGKDSQRRTYYSYVSVYSGLVQAVNYIHAKTQQFNHGYYRNFMSLEEVKDAEERLTDLHRQPIIMTRQQYNRLKRQIEGGRESQQITFETVLRDIVYYYLDNIEEAPEGIRKALEACKGKPCTNQRIIDNHNIDNEIGSYTDAEGNEAEAGVEGQDFEAMPSLPDMKKVGGIEDAKGTKLFYAVKASELIYKGWEAVQEYFKDYDLSEEEAKEITEWLTCLQKGEEADGDFTGKVYEVLRDFFGIKEKKGVSYRFADPPKDLDKYTALEYDLARYFNFYGLRYDAKTDTDLDEISKEAQFEEFKKDYPELYKALLAYIKKLYPKKAGACAKDPFSILASWEDLAKKGVAVYSQENNEATEEEIIEAYLKEEGNEDLPLKESLDRHIAIIEDPSSGQIDAEGNYRKSYLDTIENKYLEAYAQKEGEDSPEGIKDKLIVNSLRYIYAYLELAGILEDVYDIQDLRKTLEEDIDIQEIEQKVLWYNSLLYLMNGLFYGSKDARERKAELLRTSFTPIEIESYKPKQEDIDRVRKMIEKMRKEGGRLNSIDLLFPHIDYLQGETLE